MEINNDYVAGAFDHLVARRYLQSVAEGHRQIELPPLSLGEEALLYSAIYDLVKPNMAALEDAVIKRVHEIEKSWK